MTAIRFTAPWGKLLWVFTLVGTTVLVSVVAAMVSSPMSMLYRVLLVVLAIATLVGCALFSVRAYRLEADTLIIERPFWETRVSLRGLKYVHHDRKLVYGALRVGNGGLFVFAGYFWSRKHGWFRLAGNDILGRPVLLEYEDGTKWMVTPSHPMTFVEELRKQLAINGAN